MKRKIGRKSWAAILLVAGMLPVLTGCGLKVGRTEGGETREEKTENTLSEVQAAEPEKVSYTVWNAYWNLDGVEAQVEEMAENIQNISYFAAYFDKDDKVFIPEETKAFYEKTGAVYKERGWNCYLTIVNDQILENGTSSLKSTELLYRLLSDETVYQAHAEEILTLALEYGYDGLEIDYENIRKDDTLWGYFMPFIRYLYKRCNEEGLMLRVIIETQIEPEKIEWVEGPTYVVMCYNLYGGHSGPGPKADRTFLEDIMEKMSCVPGKMDYALANGGFDWSDDGSVKGITTAKAEKLLEESGAVAERDDISAARYFTYEDENGIGHEVWYADEETMQAWMFWLQSGENYAFSIWRLGE
ncbi:MAG: glycosyl hydrolase family 18 protein [Lachnospiraceae bacterium]|nr:glycosyl hydrolase family 18 protein [Lachnospiraceae bacterium]